MDPPARTPVPSQPESLVYVEQHPRIVLTAVVSLKSCQQPAASHFDRSRSRAVRTVSLTKPPVMDNQLLCSLCEVSAARTSTLLPHCLITWQPTTSVHHDQLVYLVVSLRVGKRSAVNCLEAATPSLCYLAHISSSQGSDSCDCVEEASDLWTTARAAEAQAVTHSECSSCRQSPPLPYPFVRRIDLPWHHWQVNVPLASEFA